tara:strand:+ start:75 stop:536 length:462 start_codon:yes stop_codon:yes gene_type:complete
MTAQIKQLKHTALYALLMALLIFALKWIQWKYLIEDHSTEIYTGLIALLFTALGVWIAMQLAKGKVKTVVVEKEVFTTEFVQDEQALAQLDLTNREYEVLELLVKGASNAEIADRLCLSISTIKTHVSNLLVKMHVKSRTQAIEKARRLKILP